MSSYLSNSLTKYICDAHPRSHQTILALFHRNNLYTPTSEKKMCFFSIRAFAG